MTISKPFHKMFDVDVAASSIALLIPTRTAPSGNGVIPVDDSTPSAGIDDFLTLCFYSNRSSGDNETATAKITGWRQIRGLYIPLPLASLALTFGTTVGLAADPVVTNTQYFADTITQAATLLPDSQVISPADNSIAYVKLDPFGCELIQVQLAKGTNTSLNVLSSFFSQRFDG